MAKKQTRRSISVTGRTYQRFQTLCKLQDESMSGYLEKLIAAACEHHGVPEVVILKPSKRGPSRTTRETREEHISAHFTF